TLAQIAPMALHPAIRERFNAAYDRFGSGADITKGIASCQRRTHALKQAAGIESRLVRISQRLAIKPAPLLRQAKDIRSFSAFRFRSTPISPDECEFVGANDIPLGYYS